MVRNIRSSAVGFFDIVCDRLCSLIKKGKKMPTININDIPEPKIVKLVDLSEDSINKIAEAVAQKITEPTEEQIKEYCRKRNLVIVNSDLFNEMKARWLRDIVKHGHWELSPFDGNWTCSKCGSKPYHDNMKNMNYCPNCGAKMTYKVKKDEIN